MSELGIGKLITTEQHRDAIHVAIAPVTATERLYPGQQVDAEGTTKGKPVGIVDPFLTGPVFPEQRYWLFLFPNTVTSLRHEWTHPAFAVNQPTATEQTLPSNSEIWLRAYAMRLKPYEDADEAFENLIRDLRNGEVYGHGTDLHSFDELDSPDELQAHASAYLGVPINWGNFTFSCSC